MYKLNLDGLGGTGNCWVKSVLCGYYRLVMYCFVVMFCLVIVSMLVKDCLENKMIYLEGLSFK